MSTIPEVVAAREEKLEVLLLSLVTNMVVIPDTYRSIKEEVEAEVCEQYGVILVAMLIVVSAAYWSRRRASTDANRVA